MHRVPRALGQPAGVDGRGRSRHCTYRKADRLLLPSVHQVCQLLWPFVRGPGCLLAPGPSPESPPAGGCLCLGDMDRTDLDSAWDPGAVHPTGHVDRVSPDVVLRPASPDHPGHHRPNVDAWKVTTMWRQWDACRGGHCPLQDRGFLGSPSTSPFPKQDPLPLRAAAQPVCGRGHQAAPS